MLKLINKLKNNESICIVDFETNGFTGSVLEIAVIKADKELNIVDSLNRYYFPIEDFNPYSISVNGLNKKTLMAKRKGKSYPEYFEEDREVVEFFKDMKLFIAHNVNFDKKFMPIDMNKIDLFCTMRSHTNILKIPQIGRKTYKVPKLEEVCKYYKIDFDQKEAHSGIYDVSKTFEIIKLMLNNNN